MTEAPAMITQLHRVSVSLCIESWIHLTSASRPRRLFCEASSATPRLQRLACEVSWPLCLASSRAVVCVCVSIASSFSVCDVHRFLVVFLFFPLFVFAFLCCPIDRSFVALQYRSSHTNLNPNLTRVLFKHVALVKPQPSLPCRRRPLLSSLD